MQGQAILGARTPIIKLFDPVSRERVDIACTDDGDNAVRASGPY